RRAHRAEDGLAARAAEGRADVGALAGLQQDDGDDGEAHQYVDDRQRDDHLLSPGGGAARRFFHDRDESLRVQAGAAHQRAVHLAADELVALTHLAPALGVADQHAATAELDEHGRRDLARVRAGRLVVAVLGAETDGGPLDDLADGHQGGVRRTEHDVDTLEALETVAYAAGERARLGEGAEHLPVADHEGRAHQAASVRAATPGSVRPSRNSRKAPPAVEM